MIDGQPCHACRLRHGIQREAGDACILAQRSGRGFDDAFPVLCGGGRPNGTRVGASRHPGFPPSFRLIDYTYCISNYNPSGSHAMQIVLIIALSLHILSSVFWAGTSFTLARTGGVGGVQLFRPQMGAAVIAVLIGGRAIRSLRNGMDEAGARSHIATAQRIAAALLAVTAVCMGAARYA